MVRTGDALVHNLTPQQEFPDSIYCSMDPVVENYAHENVYIPDNAVDYDAPIS